MTNDRIAQWIETCRNSATPAQTASQLFEQSIRDMTCAGYRLPRDVVAAVRSALQTEV